MATQLQPRYAHSRLASADRAGQRCAVGICGQCAAYAGASRGVVSALHLRVGQLSVQPKDTRSLAWHVARHEHYYVFTCTTTYGALYANIITRTPPHMARYMQI